MKRWGRKNHIWNADKQLLKCFEEMNEITREFVRGRYNTPEVIDSLGDSMVTLIILADILGYDIRDCLNEAYTVISKRTGETISGSFVKSEDLKEQNPEKVGDIAKRLYEELEKARQERAGIIADLEKFTELDGGRDWKKAWQMSDIQKDYCKSQNEKIFMLDKKERELERKLREMGKDPNKEAK